MTGSDKGAGRDPFGMADIRWAVALVLIAAIPRLALVLFQALDVGLGYDALQSVTHAWLSPAALCKSLRLYDPHPPLYYLQLHYWMKAGTSDLWLMLNSVGWSLAAVLSLFAAARVIYGRRAAVIAALVFAAFPYPVWYATDVRMYSMLMALAIGVYFFTHRLFNQERGAWGSAAGLLAASTAFVYTHGAGILIVTAVAAYACLGLLSKPRPWRRVLGVFAMQALLVFLFWRWMSHQQVKEVAHTQFTDVLAALRTLLFGYNFGASRWLGWASAAWLLAVAAVAARHRESFRMTLCFGLVPLAACAAVSALVKPIWLTRTFIYVLPFLALAVGLGASQPALAGRRLSLLTRHAGLALLAVTLLASWAGLARQQSDFPHWYRFKQPAQFVRLNSIPAEAICIPNDRTVWCWNWYYIGPGSVNPLKPKKSQTLPDGQVLHGPRSWGSAIQRGDPCWIVYRDVDKQALRQAVPHLALETTEKKWFRNVLVRKVRFKEKDAPAHDQE